MKALWALPLAALFCDPEEARASTHSSTTAEPSRIDGPPPKNRLAFQSITALRANPLGLLELLTLSYRSRIHESEVPALLDNFAGLGFAAELTPAFGRIGPLLEIQPLSVLRLWATYQVAAYFGTFDLFQSFPSPSSDYSDDRLDALGALEGPAANYRTTGTQVTFGANLQAKVGPIAARSGFRLVRPDYDLRDGDRTFYDQFYDLLVLDEGWYFTNDADLLFVTELGLAAGLRWTASRVFYDGGEAPMPDAAAFPTSTHRLGPFLAYNFDKGPPGVFFNNPTAIVIVNWWLEHPYRTGQEVSQAVPYIVLGFAFNGDVWVDEGKAQAPEERAP